MKRIVFLFALLFSMSFSSFGQRGLCEPGSVFRALTKRIFSSFVFWSALFCLLTISSFSQTHNLPQPQMSDTTENSLSPPPPVGLPINDHLPILLIAGLGLGIYLLRIRKTA